MSARVRVAVVALLLLAGLLAVPSGAAAHGALRRSEPAAGARLDVAPRVVRLVFTEPVELAVARVALLGPGGPPVALSALRRGDSASVIVADVVGPLAAGEHVVEWQVAGRDGHPVRGTFRFTIAPGAAGLAAAPPVAPDDTRTATPADTVAHAAHEPAAAPATAALDAQSPTYAAVRWLGFAATLALVGALGFGRVVLPRAERRASGSWSDATRGVRRVGLMSGVALLAAALVRLWAQSAAVHGVGSALDPALVTRLVGDTTWGGAWLLQVAAAALAVAGFATLARRPSLGWTMAALAGLGAALSASLSGHAAALPRLVGLAVVTDAAHVLAAGGWLGTLLVLAVVGLPAALRRGPGERRAAAATLVDAFSPLALLCAAVVALTGAAAAWLHLGGLDALLASGYGRTLLVKLGVLALVAAVGAWNWRRLRPALAADEEVAGRLRRSSLAELALGAVVLAVTAVLVATPTPLDGPR